MTDDYSPGGFGGLSSSAPIWLALCVCAVTAQTYRRISSIPYVPSPAIYALAFSPDGKTLAVGTHRQALLYDTSKWNVTNRFTSIEHSVRSLTFHPDGKHLAVGSGIPGTSGQLTIWDVSEPGKTRSYAPAKDTIEGIAFSKDGGSLLTASFDNVARLYPKTEVGSSSHLEEHNGRVTAVGFSTKPGYIFATGAMDKMVKVWEVKNPHVVVNFDQATSGITGLAFLANGDQLVAASMDGNLYWWGVSYDDKKQVYSGYGIRSVGAHDRGVTAFGVSGDHQRIITGGADHKVKVWKTDDGSQIREFKEPSWPIYCAALSQDGKIAAAAGREGVVWVWDVENDKLLTTIAPAALPASSITIAKRQQ